MSGHQWLQLQSAQKAKRSSSLDLLDLSEHRAVVTQKAMLLEEATDGAAAEADSGASETAGHTERNKKQ